MQTGSQYQITLRRGTLIGSGATSKVYECHDLSNSTVRMVCKVFSPKHKNDFAKECRAYHKLKGIMGISHLLCFGIRKSCHYIVIERMFSTLEDFSEDQPNQIDLALIAKLACTLLKILQAIHSKGIVHGDIKPANIGLRMNNDRVIPSLFDFSKASLWQLGAIRPRPAGVTGTVTYASVNVLAGHMPSPHDGIISLTYSMIYVLTVRISNVHEEAARKLWHGLVAEEFLLLLDHTSSLKFRDIPKYAHFIDTFQQLSAVTVH
ncbi:kinase-like protein [Athelia psychrophila]|uniref:Kinase-like protein n=1 Tax=Athelia psychrophila TaxID=1759441 RepID=A0A166WCS2_9AGAM|nr:kinase-like protein [Fibularhizoctonia sp. CBS 109695]